MPKFTLLGLSCSPLSLKYPKYGPLWPKHGPHMVLKIGFSWISIRVPREVSCQIAHCWVYPIAPFTRNGPNMALLWPRHGPHIVLEIGSFWIIIIVPRDAPCQTSICWLIPVAPFPRNGQKWPFYGKTWSTHGPALYGQNMVLTWSLKWVFP